MVIVSRTNPGLNRNRYFPSIRTILIVRLDPGNISSADTTDVVIEDEAEPVSRPFPDPQALFPDPQTLTATDPIGAAFEANANLADAIAEAVFTDPLSRVLDIQPLSSTRSVNSFRIADELQVKLNWKDFPFDARIIRAMAVLHFEGTTTADGFSTKERGEGRNPTGYIVPATPRNLRFFGLVDDFGDSHSAGGDYATLKARDFTAALIDSKVPPNLLKKIRQGDNLLQTVSQLLAAAKKGTTAAWIRGPYLRPSTLRLDTLDPKCKTQTTASSRNRAGRGSGDPEIVRKPEFGNEESYWDAITDICVANGFLPFIDLNRLVIQPPRTLFTGTPEVIGSPGTPTFPTEFRRGIADTAFNVRRMVYGGNIDSMTIRRKLARIQAPSVRVSSYNPDATRSDKRLLSAIHPPKASQNKDVADRQTPDGKGKKKTVHQVIVYGICDEAVLRQVAEAVYEGIGRQALGITITTSDLASFSDHPRFDPNRDPDLLAIRAGDPIKVIVAPTDLSSTGRLFAITELSKLIQRSRRVAQATGGRAEFSDAIRFLTVRGWSEEDARQLIRVLSSANLLSEFRVNTASISMDMESENVSISIDMRDYIRARHDPGDPARSGGGVGTVTVGGVVA